MSPRLATAVACLLALSARAAAAPIPAVPAGVTFTFNDLAEGAGNAAVQSSLSAVWAGTTVTGALGQRTYLADGHVVGPVVDGAVVPLTLGSTDGGAWHAGYDGFVANQPSTDRFTITLPAPVYAVAFDFQIFPNGHEAVPDFTFAADGAVVFHLLGRKPGSAAAPAGVVPGVALTDTPAHSPFSGTGAAEPVYQLLGHYAGLFPNGVTRLEFIDWPQRVAIDNLSVDPAAPAAAVPTPEPAAALVWAAGLAGVAAAARRARGRAAFPPAAGVL